MASVCPQQTLFTASCFVWSVYLVLVIAGACGGPEGGGGGGEEGGGGQTVNKSYSVFLKHLQGLWEGINSQGREFSGRRWP